MFTATQTTARHAPRIAKARRSGLLGWVIRLNAAYREKQQFAQLDADARRDMGLEGAEKITVAEILSRSTR